MVTGLILLSLTQIISFEVRVKGEIAYYGFPSSVTSYTINTYPKYWFGRFGMEGIKKEKDQTLILPITRQKGGEMGRYSKKKEIEKRWGFGLKKSLSLVGGKGSYRSYIEYGPLVLAGFPLGYPEVGITTAWSIYLGSKYRIHIRSLALSVGIKLYWLPEAYKAPLILFSLPTIASGVDFFITPIFSISLEMEYWIPIAYPYYKCVHIGITCYRIIKYK